MLGFCVPVFFGIIFIQTSRNRWSNQRIKYYDM